MGVLQLRLRLANPRLARRARQICREAAARGERLSYGELARRLGLSYPHHSPQIDAALTLNMVEDAEAGRPFASVAVVQGGGNGIPGGGFFTAAWALGRLRRGDDERDFVEREWLALCQACEHELIAA
jgi:hypothetical protein